MNRQGCRIAVCLLMFGLLLSGCGSGTPPGPTLTSPPPVALTIPGVVLYYPFNGDATDMSASHNNGKVSGPTLAGDRFGNPNRAYHFDGVDDYISFDTSKLPLGNSSRTISAWIKAESWPPEAIPGLGPRATVIGWGADDWQKLSELQIVSGRLQFHCYDAWGRDVTSNAVLELNQWYHLAIVYAAEGSASVYVNGIEDKYGPGALDTPTGTGRIGAYPDPKTNGFDASYFHGIIDDVSVYNQALTDAQIQALYSEGGWGKQ
jgi:hypothetical protein